MTIIIHYICVYIYIYIYLFTFKTLYRYRCTKCPRRARNPTRPGAGRRCREATAARLPDLSTNRALRRLTSRIILMITLVIILTLLT